MTGIIWNKSDFASQLPAYNRYERNSLSKCSLVFSAPFIAFKFEYPCDFPHNKYSVLKDEYVSHEWILLDFWREKETDPSIWSSDFLFRVSFEVATKNLSLPRYCATRRKTKFFVSFVANTYTFLYIQKIRCNKCTLFFSRKRYTFFINIHTTQIAFHIKRITITRG